MKLPAAEVTDVRFRGGRMTYLSDLRPSKVEEMPYFGRKLPWRRDVNLLGEPLKIERPDIQRGVAVHSRSVLTYDLNGRYATFEALVGFDDARAARAVSIAGSSPTTRRSTPIPTSAPATRR